MSFLTRDKPPIEQLKHAAIEAAVRALGDEKASSKEKPALTGVRAVATGALLYTVGHTAFKARRLILEQFVSQRAGDERAIRARERRVKPERHDHEFADDVRSDGKPETAEADGPDASDEAHEQMPEATEQDEPDDESRFKATPPPKRKPLQPAVPNRGPQPSLKLPEQRWTLRSRART